MRSAGKRRQSIGLWLAVVGLVSVGSWSLFAQTAGEADNSAADFGPKPPIRALTPEQQAQTFVMPPGYRMELVVAEPDVITPAVVEWDGNGRMYVAEFITYMRNFDGNDQREPINRITRFEDTNADGTYDRRTIFADNLVLPRFILTLDEDSILTNETDSDDVIKFTDTNGDGVADKREVFYTGVGQNRDGNLEHMQSGFVWGLDNWIYSTYNAFRFRWTPSGILREPTGPNQGQWGLTQDDDGKMWFVCAGCERGPINFHVPIQYGAFPRLDGEFEEGFDIVWPIAGVGDVQGGMGRVRMPTGVLNHFTATGGAEIVRAHRVPEDLKGDLLFTEPVGRLIRRAKIVKDGGFTQLRNAYPGSEFILSSDLLFRPVNIKTGPDGSLYIVDMYHGIIQEAQWIGPGSYLRLKVQQYGMEKIISQGRIWRLRFDGKPGIPATPNGPAARATPEVPPVPAIPLDLTRPQMLRAPAAQLVPHLSHENGWWRDTAQRLLVLKQDKSIVPQLETIVRTSDNLIGRFHALWTLEGLNALTPELVRIAIKDPNPRMRIQGIRASETLYKGGNRGFADDYKQAASDGDPDVALQALLTLNTLSVPGAMDTIKATVASNQAKGIQVIGGRLAQPPQAGRGGRGAGRGGFSPAATALLERGETIYNELCISCHGEDGRGTPHSGGAPGQTMAPPLAGSAHVQGHRDFVIKTILGGLTGPNNGRNYTEVMIPMAQQSDDWVAAVASYIRNGFGNAESMVTPADVARVRGATAGRTLPWTVDELNRSLPVLLQTLPSWRATASHNSADAPRGLNTQGWSSGEPQAAGMWFQVELPEPTMIAEVQWQSAGAGRGGGGGRGGRGAAGPPPPPLVRAYQLQTSLDGQTWSQPVASGDIETMTMAAFNPVRTRFIRITQTATSQNPAPWSVINLRIYGAGPGTAVAAQ
jgi:mono/diheme cytochrome c family protein/glucose/arabinose dehydrogenase